MHLRSAVGPVCRSAANDNERHRAGVDLRGEPLHGLFQLYILIFQMSLAVVIESTKVVGGEKLMKIINAGKKCGQLNTFALFNKNF